MASYASPADLVAYALPPQAVAAIPTSVQQTELDAASETANDYIRGRGQLPLQTPYPQSLVKMVCYIAAWNLMSTRGFSPSGADKQIQLRYAEAIEWLKGVQRQAIHPALVFSQPPAQDPEYGLPQVRSDPPRGWGFRPGHTPRIG